MYFWVEPTGAARDLPHRPRRQNLVRSMMAWARWAPTQ
jgi:hypothetical protein